MSVLKTPQKGSWDLANLAVPAFICGVITMSQKVMGLRLDVSLALTSSGPDED